MKNESSFRVRVPRETHTAMIQLAYRQKTTFSALLREAVEDLLAKKAK